ncbi:MAG: hypothetical protein DWQ37_16415 [Planctomycetota bacterium]|nr:MAG: hypothetical protein DWQ37_16415 [Planctomycetota bacterium]
MPGVDFPQSHCLGGLARCDITPPVGIYHRMWGAATHDRSTGVHRPLTATALALAPDADGAEHFERGQLQVIVGVDHCLLWNEQMDQLRAAVARGSNLGADQVHVSMSHTHAAGLMDPGRAALPGGELIGPYLDTLAKRVGAIVRHAVDDLRPVRMMYGTGRCSLATHRDCWDAENELYVCGFNPDGPADDTVLVARISNTEGRTLGTVVNYACHPTTLAWQNTLISPDYVGAMREIVETASGAPCLFLQGASGDLGPREGFVGEVETADRNGRQLGHAALAAIESLPAAGMRFEYVGPVVSGATIGTWAEQPLAGQDLQRRRLWRAETLEVELPLRPGLPTADEIRKQQEHWAREEHEALARGEADAARDCRAQVERTARTLARLAGLTEGTSLRVPIHLWRLGDASWLLLPGEHYHLLQRVLRQRFAYRPLVVATVTDGWQPGYVPTAETYGRGIYQESIALVAPGALESLIEQVGDYLAAWND